jgi:hypothetical protein
MASRFRSSTRVHAVGNPGVLANQFRPYSRSTVDGQLRSFLQKLFTPQAVIAKLQDRSVRNISGGSRALLLWAGPPRNDD